MVQSCAVGKMKANIWLLWEGTRLPFTACQWSAQLEVRQMLVHFWKLQECHVYTSQTQDILLWETKHTKMLQKRNSQRNSTET